MIRRVAVPALQLDPGVSLDPRSATPSYDFADPLGSGWVKQLLWTAVT
jgi:hypothetical protein